MENARIVSNRKSNAILVQSGYLKEHTDSTTSITTHYYMDATKKAAQVSREETYKAANEYINQQRKLHPYSAVPQKKTEKNAKASKTNQDNPDKESKAYKNYKTAKDLTILEALEAIKHANLGLEKGIADFSKTKQFLDAKAAAYDTALEPKRKAWNKIREPLVKLQWKLKLNSHEGMKSAIVSLLTTQRVTVDEMLAIQSCDSAESTPGKG